MTTTGTIHISRPLTPTRLPVNEVFGPTWQGEGPHAGRRTWFVRLGLCNLTCEWCDTAYTWDRSRYDLAAENPEMDTPAIHARLAVLGARAGDTITLSGGEPLMHHQRLESLFMIGPGYVWHAETNGTIPPPHYWTHHVLHTSVSPKVSTRDPIRKRFKPKALHKWAELARAGLASFKFVAQTGDDVDLAAQLAKALGVPHERTWVMPEGTTTEAVIATHRRIAPVIAHHQLQTTTRLHTLLWGDERGR